MKTKHGLSIRSQRKTVTDIICTIGPSCDPERILGAMIRQGMDIARLNFSHGSHAEHLRRIRSLRKLSAKLRRPVRVLQDLEGYRIRVGRFKDGKPILLKKSQKLALTNRSNDTLRGQIPFDYEGSLKAIKPGSHIFIDDGNIALRVLDSGADRLRTEVLVGGLLKERKGINIPEFKVPFVGLTEKDRADLEFGLHHGVDMIAQSFVRSREDMEVLRESLGSPRRKPLLLAKIENREGVENLEAILEAADGILVARGDMGVCLPIYEVPLIQKWIIDRCNRKGKFVITATQMLESMTEHVRPTRAEVSDVANAILDGSDAVMLSAESAAGKYPVESVRMMDQIVYFTELFLNRSSGCLECLPSFMKRFA